MRRAGLIIIIDECQQDGVSSNPLTQKLNMSNIDTLSGQGPARHNHILLNIFPLLAGVLHKLCYCLNKSTAGQHTVLLVWWLYTMLQ